MVVLLGRGSKKNITAAFHKCFSSSVYFCYLVILSSRISYFLLTTSTFAFGGQILCFWVVHTVFSGCLLNKYAVFSTFNSRAKPPSTQYEILLSNFSLMCVFPALWTVSTPQIHFWSTLTCLKIHCGSTSESNGFKTTLSPQLVLSYYLVFSTHYSIIWKYDHMRASLR